MAEHGDEVEEKDAWYSHFFDEARCWLEFDQAQKEAQAEDERLAFVQALPFDGIICRVVVCDVPLCVWRSLLVIGVDEI